MIPMTFLLFELLVVEIDDKLSNLGKPVISQFRLPPTYFKNLYVLGPGTNILSQYTGK